MVITHKKGDNKSSPFILRIFNQYSFSFSASFTDSCQYDHNGDDQYDWNKLVGISMNLIASRQNSLMCGWRYNLETESFELCGYYHRNGSFEPPSSPLCSVKANEWFKVSFIFNKVMKNATIIIETKEGVFTDCKEFSKFGLSRYINTWFGGNKAAPQDMTINLSQI